MIFSIDVRQRTVRSVELVCPRCGLDRTGAEVVPARWACVLGRPLVPLGEHEALVVCDDCGHSSDLGVLDVPTTAQLAALLAEATHAALVLAVRSVGRSGADAARDAALAVLRETGFDVDDDSFDSEVVGLTVDAARERIGRIACELTAYGKQGFLHRVAAVVFTHEPITQQQRDTLVQIGCDLRMAAPHINGVLAVAAIPA